MKTYQSKTRPANKEADAVYFLEKNRVSRAPSVKSEIKILLPIWPSIDSNRWKACGIIRSEWFRLPSGYHQNLTFLCRPDIDTTVLVCSNTPAELN